MDIIQASAWFGHDRGKLAQARSVDITTESSDHDLSVIALRIHEKGRQQNLEIEGLVEYLRGLREETVVDAARLQALLVRSLTLNVLSHLDSIGGWVKARDLAGALGKPFEEVRDELRRLSEETPPRVERSEPVLGGGTATYRILRPKST